MAYGYDSNRYLWEAIKCSPYPVIGLTGGIACGKSTVGRILSLDLGWIVIDADVVARRIVEQGTIGWRFLWDSPMFGDQYFDGYELNRSRLAQYVFENKAALLMLESVFNPLIQNYIAHTLTYSPNKPMKGGFAIDSALIVEHNQQKWFDSLWVVTTSPETQLARLMARNKLSAEEAQKRINAQLPLAVKEKAADALLCNEDANPHELVQIVMSESDLVLKNWKTYRKERL